MSGSHCAHFGDDARDRVETLAQQYAETLAFALARGEHVVERMIEQIERGLPQAFLIDFLAQQHARPFQQAGEIAAEVRKARR